MIQKLYCVIRYTELYCFFWYLFQGGFLCYLRGHSNKSMQIGECQTCDKIWDRIE